MRSMKNDLHITDDNNSTDISVNEFNVHDVKEPNKNMQQYLTFKVANELYGVDILKVQEIRGCSPATQMPNAPEFIRGVMNLRGSVVPILDIRRRFNMPEVEFTAQTVIIVVNIYDRTIGMIVDNVSDVVDVSLDDMRDAPDFGSSIDSSFIEGLSPQGDEMIILINVDEMMKSSDLIKIDEIIEEGS